MCRAFIGFIYFHDGAGAVAFFKDNTQATTTALNVFVGLAFVVGDGMIVSSSKLLSISSPDRCKDLPIVDRMVPQQVRSRIAGLGRDSPGE
jgi:hypothetical protein